MTRSACYTCITGGYNELLPHPPNPDVDWIAFVDNPVLIEPHGQDWESGTSWQLRPCHPYTGNDRLRAKYHKLHPHRVLPDYDHSVWIDGTVSVLDPDFPNQAMAYVNDSGLALWPHPFRQDAYSEMLVSAAMPKYVNEPMFEQMGHYNHVGFPFDYGLWAGGVLARHHTKVEPLMQTWWANILRWSIQDQLSLPFVLWRLGATPGEFPQSLYVNDWLSITGHNPLV